MQTLVRSIMLFVVGGLGYGLIEILARGYTHWSMVIAGGLALLILDTVFTTFGRHYPLIVKCLIGAAVITLIELGIGYFVNIRMGWGVWEYSSQPLNFKGQICLLYSTIWFALTVPITWLSNLMHRFL